MLKNVELIDEFSLPGPLKNFKEFVRFGVERVWYSSVPPKTAPPKRRLSIPYKQLVCFNTFYLGVGNQPPKIDNSGCLNPLSHGAV